MDSKQSQKSQQNPGKIIVDWPFSESQIRPAIHAGYQEQIDNPADKKQSQREQIDSSGYGMSEIESMGSCKTKNPQNITDCFAMGVVAVAQFYAPNPDKPESKGNQTTKITKNTNRKMKI